MERTIARIREDILPDLIILRGITESLRKSPLIFEQEMIKYLMLKNPLLLTRDDLNRYISYCVLVIMNHNDLTLEQTLGNLNIKESLIDKWGYLAELTNQPINTVIKMDIAECIVYLYKYYLEGDGFNIWALLLNRLVTFCYIRERSFTMTFKEIER